MEMVTNLDLREAAAPRSGSRRAEIHPVVFGLPAARSRSAALESPSLPLSLSPSVCLSPRGCV